MAGAVVDVLVAVDIPLPWAEPVVHIYAKGAGLTAVVRDPVREQFFARAPRVQPTWGVAGCIVRLCLASCLLAFVCSLFRRLYHQLIDAADVDTRRAGHSREGVDKGWRHSPRHDQVIGCHQVIGCQRNRGTE